MNIKYLNSWYRFLIISCLQLACFMTYGQVGINENIPNKTADLTLGSIDKSMLFNRVELQSQNSPKPLSDAELSVGIIVFNTKETVELSSGFYFWSSEKKWNKLFMKSARTRQSNYIDFLQTKSVKILVDPKIPFELEDLNYDYSAEESGTIFLDYVLYASLTSNNALFIGSSKTTFVCIVTDSTNKEVFKGAVAVSPLIVASQQGNNSVTGKGNFFFDVVAGEKYKIRLSVVDYYDGQYQNSIKIQVGNYEAAGNVTNSSLMLTFLSKASL